MIAIPEATAETVKVRKKQKVRRKIIVNAIAYSFIEIYVFPLYWIIASSLKRPGDLFSYPIKLFPSPITFSNYTNAWNSTDFPLYIRNTFFVAVVATTLIVLLSLMCGYALAIYKYKWMSIIFMCIISTSMLPTEVIMNSVMHVVRGVGLYDNLWGIIIPVLGSSSNILIARQFFITVPSSIMESARLEGASELSIFFRLMLPLAKPTIFVITIFSFRSRWNSYVWPLIALSDPKKNTIQVALRNLVGAESIDWSLLLSATAISIIPMFIIFLIFQKYIFGEDASVGIK